MQGVISFIGFRGFSHVILHPKAGVASKQLSICSWGLRLDSVKAQVLRVSEAIYSFCPKAWISGFWLQKCKGFRFCTNASRVEDVSRVQDVSGVGCCTSGLWGRGRMLKPSSIYVYR